MPPSGKPPPDEKTFFGAHGCYVQPGLFLARARELEIEASYGVDASTPTPTDVTEALVLIERGKAPASPRAALLSGNPNKTKKALAAIFTHLKSAEAKRLETFRTPDKFYDGDYVALGLLKAKRLKSKAVFTDDVWRQVVSRTQLRNDVRAHGWEDIAQMPPALKSFFGKTTVDVTQWRSRRRQTLDTILSSAVCDQTSESGELIRSGNVGNAIPSNAGKPPTLRYLTFSNAKHIRRGMHLFFTGFGEVKSTDQGYVVTGYPLDPYAIFAADPDPSDPKKKLQELTPIDKLSKIPDLEALLDPDDPSNKAAAAENARRKAAAQKQADADAAQGRTKPDGPRLLPRVVVRPDLAFTGVLRIEAGKLENTAKDKDENEAFVRCEKGKDGKFRLHACKWTHQEIVIDVKVSPTRIQVFTFSTAGGADHGSGTGVRQYNLSPNGDGGETRLLNVVFGFMYPNVKENTSLLDACFLNPKTLVM